MTARGRTLPGRTEATRIAAATGSMVSALRERATAMRTSNAKVTLSAAPTIATGAVGMTAAKGRQQLQLQLPLQALQHALQFLILKAAW